MKREFLEGLGLEQDAVDKIMKENGRDIESVRAKFADYDDVKKQLAAANETMEKFKDYDQVKAEVEKWKSESERLQKEGAERISTMERTAKVKDFLSGKKFVNDITRDAMAAKLGEMLSADGSKGKSMDELFEEIVGGKTDILADENKPQPPVVPPMGGKGGKLEDDAQARAVMGLPPRKE